MYKVEISGNKILFKPVGLNSSDEKEITSPAPIGSINGNIELGDMRHIKGGKTRRKKRKN
jgi:hypothetical protein